MASNYVHGFSQIQDYEGGWAENNGLIAAWNEQHQDKMSGWLLFNIQLV